MDNQTKFTNALNEEEEKELREGQALYEMTQTPGFDIVLKKYEQLAFHSWIDPRTIDAKGGLSKQEWEWRELNGFHAANAAAEMLDWIKQSISRSEYLSKKKNGEIDVKRMKV